MSKSARTLSTYAQAAAQIRAELKKHGIPAKVTSEGYSMGSSVNVKLTGEPLPATVKAVESFAMRYQYGYFDGMQDLYVNSNRNSELPQAKFVFVTVDYSDSIKRDAWNWAKANLSDFESAPDYDNGRNWYSTDSREYGDTIVWRILNAQDGFFARFWTTRKPRIAA